MRRGVEAKLVQLVQIFAVLWSAVIVLELELPSFAPWGNHRLEKEVERDEEETHSEGRALYGRAVVMLVDALREDFVHEREEMAYVRQLIAREKAKSFVSYANTPTVTMPRIKALMTGGVPRFIDVMNNLDSKELREDNIVERMKLAGKRSVLYGDETWLKLFPNHFFRTDGTSSFFTKDFTEVDDNITRHLDQEFDPLFQDPKSRDWDCIFLHYLGLDHIGHQHGPDSTHMHVKLKEMDRIFRKIHVALQKQEIIRQRDECTTESVHRCNSSGKPLPTLLVLLSDHGMNKVGNHGGASSPETSAFLLLVHVTSWHGEENSSSEYDKNFPDKFDRREISQIDLAPTLGMLLGIGIPKRSVGSLIPEAFSSFDPNEYKDSLTANARQLIRLAQERGISVFSDQEVTASMTVDELEQLISRLGDQLSTSSESNSQSELSSSDIQLILCVATLVFSVVFMGIPIVQLLSSEATMSTTDAILCSISFLHVISLTSSSAIENEHVVWFFLFTSWICVLLWQDLSRLGWKGLRSNSFFSIVAILALLRLLRFRLQIINFARLAGLEPPNFIDEGAAVLAVPDIISSSPMVAISLVSCGFFSAWTIARSRGGSANMKRFGALTVLVATILLLRIKVFQSGSDMVISARLTYLSCAFLVFCAIWGFKYSDQRSSQDTPWNFFLSSVLLLCLLLHRQTSTMIIAISYLLSRLLAQLWVLRKGSTVELVFSQWTLAQCIFFALGNSHVIATIDISGAYTGLTEYSQTIVGTLTAIITFTGLLLPMCTTFATLSQCERQIPFFHVFYWNIAISVRILVATIVLVAMRTHLFIWSVFAPKWIYEALLFYVSVFLSLLLQTQT